MFSFTAWVKSYAIPSNLHSTKLCPSLVGAPGLAIWVPLLISWGVTKSTSVPPATSNVTLTLISLNVTATVWLSDTVNTYVFSKVNALATPSTVNVSTSLLAGTVTVMFTVAPANRSVSGSNEDKPSPKLHCI